MTEWTWEPDDFAALWYSEANDRFPSPLHYLSRFPYLEDYQAHREQVRSRYSADAAEEVELLVHTLSTSDIRIEILGSTTELRGTIWEYRILGARNLFHGAVLCQSIVDRQPEGIRARLCRPEHLPTRIVNALLPADPGSQPAASFYAADITAGDGDYRDDYTRSSPRERFERLLRRPAHGEGIALLHTGSILHRADPSQTIRWHDITGDGRYTERRDGDLIHVRPTVPKELIGEFTTWIDDAARRLRGDEDYEW
ncbi:ESX secretion-associated protein EspG [Nocardia arthritidis]|uniref:ESX secretion-associated protein EspG n=1 Tax=Nocardia arthritidis TaxID=228602 RepID=A0A6G9YAV4_9NOCA|nr:ESX secretion-associated protein EspG [Nocardia arthritidis]QIS10342.1 ESX secretion-associated protein EspG [Nocardia arthritidis]